MRPEVRRAIAWRARRQHGYISRVQLLAAGLSPSSISRLVASGFLITVYRGIYAVGSEPVHPREQAHAALLACGARSVLYGDSAASAYGLLKAWRKPFAVAAPYARRTSGVRFHRCDWLCPADVRIVDGVRATSPQLVLLRVAHEHPEPRLRRHLNGLRLEHGLTLEQVRATLERFPRHRNHRRLAMIVATSEGNPTRSGYEDRWRPFAIRFGLPPYEMNVRIAGHLVDVYLPDPGLIIELDGGLHDIQARSDHARDLAVLTATGIPTVRVDPEEITRDPQAQAGRLLALIDRLRRREPAQRPEVS